MELEVSYHRKKLFAIGTVQKYRILARKLIYKFVGVIFIDFFDNIVLFFDNIYVILF